ncbi:MAG: DNA repair protein RecO [Bacteroidota bacterium]|nr:DNA repair protein RecO [Bacteroidota bacterium]
MTNILKTEAIVLNKINYGDTSKIVNLFTKDTGKVSVIIKGGRDSKSKIGKITDPLNYLQIIYYQKDTREIQLLTEADLLLFFHNIKSDIDRLSYASATLELFIKLIPENEYNLRLFKGLLKILGLLDDVTTSPIDLFCSFLMFFIKEIGYEIQLENCVICGEATLNNLSLGYNYEKGIFCNSCKKNNFFETNIQTELFNYLISLKTNKKNYETNTKVKEDAIKFMEKFLKYHFTDFKELQSLRLK